MNQAKRYQERQRIEQVKSNINWRDVFGNDHIECISPYHEDRNPSMYPYPDHLFCFSCEYHTTREKVDVIEAYKLYTGKGFWESVDDLHVILARKGVRAYQKEQNEVQPIPWNEYKEHYLELKARADKRNYLRLHYALSPKIIEAAKLGYTGTAFSIPHMTGGGEIYTIKFRRDDKVVTDGPKYWGLSGREFLHPYPGSVYQRVVRRKPPKLYLTEGELDALSVMSSLGYPALAIVGSTANPNRFEEFWMQLKGQTHVVLAFDNDKAGYKAGSRYNDYFDTYGVSCSWYDYGPEKDVAEHFRNKSGLP